MKRKLGWKVVKLVDNDYYSSSENREKRMRYTKGKRKILAKRDTRFGPLFVYSNFKSARRYRNWMISDLRVQPPFHIFRCEYVPSNDKVDVDEITLPHDLLNGTVFAELVKLIGEPK